MDTDSKQAAEEVGHRELRQQWGRACEQIDLCNAKTLELKPA